MKKLMNRMDNRRQVTKNRDVAFVVAFLGFMALVCWSNGIVSIISRDWGTAVGSIILAAIFTGSLILELRKLLSPEQAVRNLTSLAPPDTQDNRPGKVYIVRAGQYYKIGITQGDVSRRVAQLQTGSPHKIHVIRVIETDRPRDLERDLHEMLRHKRVEGEWFKLSEAELRIIRRLK